MFEIYKIITGSVILSGLSARGAGVPPDLADRADLFIRRMA